MKRWKSRQSFRWIGTKHFKEFGGKWPVHCVQGTDGASLHDRLYVPKNSIIIAKGTGIEDDGYSAFEGTCLQQGPWKEKTLDEILSRLGVRKLCVGGLATDYCVKATCLGAKEFGYTVYLLTDACRGVNINNPDDPNRQTPQAQAIIYYLNGQGIEPTDENIALEELRLAGVTFATTDEVLQ